MELPTPSEADVAAFAELYEQRFQACLLPAQAAEDARKLLQFIYLTDYAVPIEALRQKEDQLRQRMVRRKTRDHATANEDGDTRITTVMAWLSSESAPYCSTQLSCLVENGVPSLP